MSEIEEMPIDEFDDWITYWRLQEKYEEKRARKAQASAPGHHVRR